MKTTHVRKRFLGFFSAFIFILFSVFCAAAAQAVSIADYFPLNHGDERVYEAVTEMDFDGDGTVDETWNGMGTSIVQNNPDNTKSYLLYTTGHGEISGYELNNHGLILAADGFFECEEGGSVQILSENPDNTNYLLPFELELGDSFTRTIRFDVVYNSITESSIPGMYAVVTANVTVGSALQSLTVNGMLFTDVVVVTMDNELHFYADGAEEPDSPEHEKITLYLAPDIGVVKAISFETWDDGVLETETLTIVKYSVGALTDQVAGLVSLPGTITDGSAPLTYVDNNAHASLATMAASTAEGTASSAPADSSGAFTLYYYDSNTPTALMGGAFLYQPYYQEITGGGAIDTNIVLTASATAECDEGGGGMPGGGGTSGVGIYMTGQIFVDTNDNNQYDAGTDVQSTGLWIDVWDEASGMWGGAPVGTDGTYSVNLPVATGNFEVNVWPDFESTTNYVGGTFVSYEGDDPADGYDGSATGDWENKTLIPVTGADVVVNIELLAGVAVSGVVKDSNGNPIQSVWVNVWSESTGIGGGAETDASGVFSASVAEGTGYDIWVDTWNLAEQGFMGGFFKDDDGGSGVDKGDDTLWSGGTTGDHMERTLIDVSSSGVSNITITLGSGTKIFGKVIDSEGNPVPWLWVDANSDVTGSWGGSSTNETGDFSMVVEPGVGYRVGCWPWEGDYVGGFWQAGADNTNTTSGQDGTLNPNWDDATLLGVSADVEINIILSAGNTISGRVTDNDGPVSWIWVEANSDSIWSWFGSSTDDEGYYRIAVSPATDYKVQVWSNGQYQTTFYNQATNWEDATLVDASSSSVSGIDLVLSTGAGISGTITGLESGDYAWIDAWSESTWSWGGTNVTGTGSDMAYQIAGLGEASDYRLNVWADGYQSGNVKSDGTLGSWDQAALFSAGAENADITLSTGKEITGTISGLSAGDYVWVDAWSDTTWSWGGANVVATGATADFTIYGLGVAQDFRVSIWADGYASGFYGGTLEEAASAPVSWDRATLINTTNDVSGLNIVLSSGNSIGGTITGLGSGEWAWIDAWSESTGSSGGANVTGTGADVTYEIKGLGAASDFRVSIWSDDYMSGSYSAGGIVNWETADLVDSSGDPSDINFALSQGQTISGTITGLDRGEWAWIDAWSESTWAWGGTSVVGLAGGTVQYEIKGLVSAADFVVNFWPDDHANQLEDNVDSSTNPTNINFVAATGNTISGSVSGAGANEWVWLDAWSESTWNWGFADVQVDASGDGTYEIKGLGDASDYVVNAWSSNEQVFYNQATSWMDATKVDLSQQESASDIDFAFGSITRYTLSGTIAGLPEDSTIWVWIDTWDDDTWTWGGTDVQGNGNFSLDLVPGNYRVGVYAYGYANVYYSATNEVTTAWDSAQEVALNQDVNIGTLTLSAGHSITGTVTESSDPVVNVWVDAYNRSAGIWGGGMTNSQGEYEIPGLPNGTYTVSIWSIDGNYEADVTIEDADVTHDITIGDEGTGDLSGTVTLGGSAAADAVVTLFDSGNTFVNAVTTDANGAYSFSGFAAGDYTVKVDTDGDGTAEDSASVIITAGGTTTHDVDVPL